MKNIANKKWGTYTLILLCCFFFNLASNLFSIEPSVQVLESYFLDHELVINLKLSDGLDFDRLHIIRKGISVKLSFEVQLVKKNTLWPDKILAIKNKRKNSLDKLLITKELTYDYLTKNYIIKISKNYSDDISVEEYYAGETIREKYKNLKLHYFGKPVQFYLDLNRLSYNSKQEYYIRIMSKFTAIKTFPIIIPNPFNFQTQTVERKIIRK